MGIIEINKSQIPYKFEIKLSSRIYEIVINYNFLFDFFTADLMLNNVTLIKSEKLVLNQFLFRDVCEDKEHNINSDFPKELLFIGTNDETISRISYDNLGETVFLYYAEREEVEIWAKILGV